MMRRQGAEREPISGSMRFLRSRTLLSVPTLPAKGSTLGVSFLYRLGQAAARHRWRTLGIWIATVVAIFVIGGALGGKFTDDFNLPDSESQRAYDLLAERYPAASGTSAYIVFHAPNGPLEDQADAVTSTLDTIAGQPHVIAVSDPFETPGALSPDGTIGYSQVAYDQPAVDLGVEPFEALQETLDGAR